MTCLVDFFRLRRSVLDELALELDSLSDVDSESGDVSYSLEELDPDDTSELSRSRLSREPEGLNNLVVPWTLSSSESL